MPPLTQEPMHRLLLAGALALAALAGMPARTAAQEPDTLLHADDAAREAARRAIAIYNAPATLRVNGSLTIDSTRTIDGDVAVFGGTLVVAGHVTGRIAAINADVALRRGARVGGEIVVAGGVLEGRADATLGGPVTTSRSTVLVREDGERLLLEEGPLVDRWWERWRTRRARDRATVRLSSGGTYNRVEGLPVHFGPVVRQRWSWGRGTIEALGIYRSAADFRWDSDNIGHDARADLAVGERRGLGVGARVYDVVRPVEDWKLSDGENGFASFLLHRDYRDHFDRHGRSAHVRAFVGEQVDLRFSLAHERWGNREDRDPWTLFRDDSRWRPNPLLDEGRFHLASLALRVDTRNDVAHPWAGWYLATDFERGTGHVTSAGVATTLRELKPDPTWVRGFLDLRRFNRLAPNTQLNMRLVLGGWLGGDPLPLNRRLSVSGPEALPGFDFRRDALSTTTCSGISPLIGGPLAPGTPAECERVALAQLEYRSDLGLDLDLWRHVGSRMRFRRVGQWVLFANSGRGWLVGPRIGEVQYRAAQFPTLSTFRTDLGGGLDLGALGVYVAKSVSDGDEPPNFYVRLRRRF